MNFGPDAVLAHLAKHGVLDLAEKLMDDDEAGVAEPTLSPDEVLAILARYTT